MLCGVLCGCVVCFATVCHRFIALFSFFQGVLATVLGTLLIATLIAYLCALRQQRIFKERLRATKKESEQNQVVRKRDIVRLWMSKAAQRAGLKRRRQSMPLGTDAIPSAASSIANPTARPHKHRRKRAYVSQHVFAFVVCACQFHASMRQLVQPRHRFAFAAALSA